MNLEHLYYFRVLAEHLNYAKSAELLHISQSNLSYAITALERELGAKLFEKIGRHIELTVHGALFLECANRTIIELESGIQSLKSLTEESIKSVRIACARVMTVTSILEDFFSQSQCESVHVEISHRKTDNIIHELKNGTIDFGICSYCTVDKNLTFQPFMRQKVVALYPKSHNLAACDHFTLLELCKYPLLIPKTLDGMYSQILKSFETIQIKDQLHIIETDSSNAAAYFAAQGKGVALTIESPSLQYFPLKTQYINDPAFEYYLYLAYRSSKWRPKLFQDFIVSMDKYFQASESNRIQQ